MCPSTPDRGPRAVSERAAAGGPGARACMPMRVLALADGVARCAGIDGVPATVETLLVGPLEPGAVVLVQAGVALLRLDAEWQP